jgi:carboxyl-terminal processing protease
MPRSNLLTIFLAAIVSLVCYRVQDRNKYGRYFSEIMEHIEERYVEEVDSDKLFVTAVRGMMHELDENSDYISKDETPLFRESLEQKFGGIGIEISTKDKALTVTHTMPDTPAYRAGILVGDQILKIDGQEVAKLSEPARMIRGKVGDPVSLTVQRMGSKEPVDIGPILREEILVPSVLGDTRDADGRWIFFLEDHPRIAYLRIATFGERTAEELDAALEAITERGFDALVLDVRNNPGGYLNAAIHTVDRFLESGTIVTVRGRDQEIRERREATSAGTYDGFPLVVLANRYSASASEIIAASLQDHQRAIVVGERTYGKGTVQNVIPIAGGQSDLKLTTAYYWRPSGKKIHRRPDASQKDGREAESAEWGVSPNEGYEVKLSDEEFKKLFEWRHARDHRNGNAPPPQVNTSEGEKESEGAVADRQLEKAVEYLKGELDKAGRLKAA